VCHAKCVRHAERERAAKIVTSIATPQDPQVDADNGLLDALVILGQMASSVGTVA